MYAGTLDGWLFAGPVPILGPGTYYWQPYLIDASACTTNQCYIVGPVTQFTVAPAAQATQVTPQSTTSSDGECVAATRRRAAASKNVRTLRRKLAHAHGRAAKRYRHRLANQRAALDAARNDIAANC